MKVISKIRQKKDKNAEFDKNGVVKVVSNNLEKSNQNTEKNTNDIQDAENLILISKEYLDENKYKYINNKNAL